MHYWCVQHCLTHTVLMCSILYNTCSIAVSNIDLAHAVLVCPTLFNTYSIGVLSVVALCVAENEKSRLKKEVLEGRQHGRDALRLQAEITELLHKLQRADEKLQISGSLLEKEKIRNKTMKSHEQVGTRSNF